MLSVLGALKLAECAGVRSQDIGAMCEELDKLNRLLIASPKSSRKLLKSKQKLMDSTISDYRNSKVPDRGN